MSPTVFFVAFVVIHLLAIAWYQFGKRTPLVGPMITGRKQLADAAQGITSSQIARGLLLAAIAAGLITALIQFAPQPTFDEFMF